ncbi:PorP/SprF family type IX secretion system membrane protein [Hymenobacter jeollabukensis]|uniref:Type IX secretion system membrane protein PorP/SprF n=1 Tax=Hymenobacter jeollabukensis TaxID=2025313 RepID=A0A5R8WVD9_9BACT|nr:type IX secretion system membrane protein PorP/SprF [Hymenobacter jeollabukensis]TLM95386.1 type IX secretion system membrane protein PorP/SprF [Hymenobacter jeollabukensis]
MKGNLLATLLLSAVAGSAVAQQQPQFSHYAFNGMYLNPAYAGIKGQGEITAIGRYQYFNYKATLDRGGEPKTYALTANLPVRAIGGGLGISIYRDEIAKSEITSASLSYSKHFKVGEEGRFGVGLQGSYNNWHRDGDYRFVDPNDPNIPANSSDNKFDAGVGVWYESPRWYAGLSVNNLLRSQYSFQSANDATKKATATAENHGYLSVGYNFDLTDNIVLTPTAVGKLVLPGKFGDGKKFSFDNNSFELGARATINDKFWGGVGYRYDESLTGMLGVAVLKDNVLRIGYAFDWIAFNQDARAFSSHEIMLSYRLPKPGLATRPAIRTPRYSF